MHAWIPEAMEIMRWEAPLSHEWEDIKIVFHKGRLPCGLVFIDAVEWAGHRLPHGNSVKNIRTSQHKDDHVLQPETWTSHITKTPTPDGNGIYFSTLDKVRAMPEHNRHYYQLELNHILTSFPDGMVRVYYRYTPRDERGLPLIPNNMNFRQCLYWYVRGRMIGAGWEDPVFKYDYCDAQYEKFMERALGEIDFPSPDQMEQRVHTFARFIPPENYYENYFEVNRAEPFYDPLGPSDSYYI